MNRLHVVLWKWNQRGVARSYDSHHVDVMAAMVKRGLRGMDFRVVCVTDDPSDVRNCETFPLWEDFSDLSNASGKHLPSCYRRLKIYDPATQRDMDIRAGDRVLSLDLDTVITGDFRSVAQTEGRFVGWRLLNKNGDDVFNGSLQMFTAGDYFDIWEEFVRDPTRARKLAAERGFQGSDQSWLTYKTMGRDGSVALGWPEVSSYPLQNKVQCILRLDNKIIFFHGKEKPWDPAAQAQAPWIQRYWRY